MSLPRRPVGLPLVGLPFCSDSISTALVLIFSDCSSNHYSMPESLEGGVSPKLTGPSVVTGRPTSSECLLLGKTVSISDRAVTDSVTGRSIITDSSPLVESASHPVHPVNSLGS